MKGVKVYRYKIKPNKKQREALSQYMGCCRYVYNWALERRTSVYNETKESVSIVKLCAGITEMRKEKDWLNDAPSESLQQSIRCLDNAFTRFFKHQANYPKFKKKKSKQTIQFVNNIHFDFDKWKVKVPKLGWIHLCRNRVFDTSLKTGTLTITKDSCNDYWCTIVVHTGEKEPVKAKLDFDRAVGIDMGIASYITLSDGTKVDNPRFLKRQLKRLEILQQRHSRTVKGSKRRERLRLKICRLYRHITNKRMDFINRLTYRLVNDSRYDTFVLESLDIKEMMKKDKTSLPLMIQDAAWHMFKQCLQYKADRAGKNVLFIGQYEPSSKLCHCCGTINRDLTLNDREWICPVCGERHDRDINAAINIKNIGFTDRNLYHSSISEAVGAIKSVNDQLF